MAGREVSLAFFYYYLVRFVVEPWRAAARLCELE